MIDFLPYGKTITAEQYCETLQKVKRAIQNKRKEYVCCTTMPVCTPPTPPSLVWTHLVGTFWTTLHILDLAPSDFHHFTFLKTYISEKKFKIDEEVNQEVLKWTKEMAWEFYEEGIKKLVPQLIKYIEREHSDYVEK